VIMEADINEAATCAEACIKFAIGLQAKQTTERCFWFFFTREKMVSGADQYF